MKNIDIFDTFGGCTTQQQVAARISAMNYEEIRELVIAIGCKLEDLDRKCFGFLGIKHKKNAGFVQPVKKNAINRDQLCFV